MRVGKEEIELYIPQRYPFVMIDNLVDVTEDTFTSDFRILPGNIFLEGDTLREYALIENIAQSSAAGLCFVNASSQKGSVEGFIGAISKLKIYELPKVNQTITTIVKKLLQLDNMYMMKGVCYADEKLLIECQLKLAGAV